MLLSELYPGQTWLEKACFLPFSRQHYPEEFHHIMRNGFDVCDFQEFNQQNKEIFEAGLFPNNLLYEAHLEFYNSENSYWVCAEQIEGVNYSLYIVKSEERILWMYLGKKER